VFHHRLFAVKASVQASMASRPTVPVLMASAPMAPGETAKMAPTLEALASALEDLAEADLGRLPAAKRQVAPAGLYRRAYSRGDESNKHQPTYNPPSNVVGNEQIQGGLAVAANRGTFN
jgi:hypothetical protein